MYLKYFSFPYFSVGRVAPVQKNSARYQEPVGKFSSGLSLDDDPPWGAVGMPRYKLSKYQYKGLA